MTKSYKATHFWMYRYDKRYTLFVYQIYKKVITNPPPHKINPLKSVQSVAKTLRKNPKIQKTQQNQTFAVM